MIRTDDNEHFIVVVCLFFDRVEPKMLAYRKLSFYLCVYFF